MADNLELNAGSGGAIIATDDDTTAHHQYVKMEWGGDGTFTKVSTGAGAVPIQDGGNTITVDGTVAVTHAALTALNTAIATEVQCDIVAALPAGTNNIGDVDVLSCALPTGASTSAKQDTAQTALDAIKTAVEILDNTVAGTELQVDVLTMPTTAVSQSGTWTVQPGNTANTTPWLISSIPATSGGCSNYHVVAAATTNTANVKASAGQLYGWSIFNAATYTVYVKLHNTAGAPTAGAGVVRTIGVPAGGGSNMWLESGQAFGTGIGISIVKDIADAGTTAVAASDCVVDLSYK